MEDNPPRGYQGYARARLSCMTLAYENKTENEETRGEINCNDDDAPSMIFPFNPLFKINLFFLEIGIKFRADTELFNIIKCLWEIKTERDGFSSENISFLTQPNNAEDIRFHSIDEIRNARTAIRGSIPASVYSALEIIFDMLDSDNEQFLEDLNKVKTRQGIVFLISRELSEKLQSSFPFKFNVRDDEILHTSIISITVTENHRDDTTVKGYNKTLQYRGIGDIIRVIVPSLNDEKKNALRDLFSKIENDEDTTKAELNILMQTLCDEDEKIR